MLTVNSPPSRANANAPRWKQIFELGRAKAEEEDGDSSLLLPDLRAALFARYDKLCQRVWGRRGGGGGRGLVAVRSSATSEDSAEASFAGQLESYLGCRGHAELEAALCESRPGLRLWAALSGKTNLLCSSHSTAFTFHVSRFTSHVLRFAFHVSGACWGSLFSKRVESYMRLAGVGGEGGEINFDTMSCCVVVQEMVAQPRAAGVMFTVGLAVPCCHVLPRSPILSFSPLRKTGQPSDWGPRQCRHQR